MPSVTVVGAGVAGLTLAHQLATKGWDVTVLESHHDVGGLGRSWHYGDFHFDVGPHRFHTENPRVATFVSDVLGEAAIEIPRKSGVRMFGKFHEWPLRPGILLAMPFSTMFRAGLDLLRKEKLDGESFEADIVNKYGRTLYEIFFKPYTEKFLFCSPAGLHRDWGRAGVNRAVIDKRAQSDGLWSLLKNTLLPAPVDTTFIYAAQGVGEFSERLTAGIRAHGGRVLLNTRVDGIEQRGGRIVSLRAGDQVFAVDNLVWTAPITLANQLLGITDVSLDYLSTIFYNLEIDAPAKLDFQWTYYGNDEVFSRISTPTSFAMSMAPAGKSGLCVEVTCREGDERWQAPEQLTEAVIADLVRTQTIDSASQVRGVHIERVPFTYPIYRLEYFSELTRNLRELGRYKNLLLAGRCGRFWYNNMDHSIGQALTMADRILKGQVLAQIDTADREFWADQPAAAQPAAAAEAGPAATPAPTALPPTTPPPAVATRPVPVATARPVPTAVPVPAFARTPGAAAPAAAAAAAAAVASSPSADRDLGWQPPSWAVWALGGTLGAALIVLAWLIGRGPMGPAYALGYGLALTPGLPLGWWLFGRRHAAGWVAGGLIGYVLTAWAIWAATAAGLSGPGDRAVAWLALLAMTWGSGLLGREPLITLPTWTRRDSLAFALTLAMVPALVGTAFVKLGSTDGDHARHYRAYFTADVLWHSALTTEISRFSWPLHNPYTADRPLHYYWTYFMVPPAIASTAPAIFGDEPLPWLLINATGAGLLFMGALFLFAWCALPRAALTWVSVSLVFLAASAEGAYILQRLWRTGGPLDALRNYNIDAVTRVVFDGLSVDDLPRSLWYTPQHAAGCALGLLALIAVAHARPRMPLAGAALAGLCLAAAVTVSPLIGGMFAVIYGLSCLVAALRTGWRDAVPALVPHAVAAAAVLVAVVVISASGMVEGAGNALHIGFVGYARRHPAGTLLLAIGPALLPGLVGLWPRKFPAPLVPAAIGLVVGIALFYLASLPYRDPIWVGWRAGQIMLVVLPPLVARALATGLLTARPLTVAAAALLFAIGLPTTIIDAYNAQDVKNDRMGAGFHWTLTLTPPQQDAFAWLRTHTPRTAVVQVDPKVRGADTWTVIPTFGQRRMWAGLPISLLQDDEYKRRTDRVHEAFATPDADQAWRIFHDAHVGYVFVDTIERTSFAPEASAKFDAAPARFQNVFRNADVAIYRVR